MQDTLIKICYQCFNDCWALCNLRPLSAKQNLVDGVTRVRHNLGGRK
jgi:hypothetical protein